ncbi:Na+/H+ antiporter NhaA [Nonomuraea sp. NPDC050404]|uniref:Na+/H+ antiporter NhaA n=1 Tax=Nonomuraea sp. NPDC050404 TaxID=3155783 RepID=UPI0033F73590
MGGFWSSTVTWGVLARLVGGKLVGILGSSWFTARFTRAHLNPQLSWLDIAGVGLLGGIGFTVSLLMAELSYSSPSHLTDAKGAILLASVVSCLLSALAFGVRGRLKLRVAR